MTTGMHNRADAEGLRISLVDASAHALTYALDHQRILLEANADVLAPSGDAEVALGFLPALRSSRTLTVDRPVSALLQKNLPELMRVFCTWLDTPPIDVAGPTELDQSQRTRGVASFFSGGVDSFYTALKHDSEIDTLVFVHGFDIPIEDEQLGGQALEHVRAAARALGKTLVEIRTDLRQYAAIDRNWGFAHGAAMAAVAHSLGDKFATVYVPATYTYRDMFPWGSHPMTDPLWSGSVEIIHDGADTTRMDKLAFLADQDTAAQHLRVCWENRGGRFNCCECEKCTRTMIALRALGALENFITFDRPLNLNRVRTGVLRDAAQTAFTRQVLRQLEAQGSDRDLIRALRWRLRVGPARRILSTWPGRLSRHLSPVWQLRAKELRASFRRFGGERK